MSIQVATQIDQNRRLAYVVDDDREVRLSLVMLLRAVGIEARPFADAEDFLSALPYLKPGCIILDVLMPEKDGLLLLEEIRERGFSWPTIIITGHGDVTSAVKAMKLGAREFLEKPFEHLPLLGALESGFLELAVGADQELQGKRGRQRLANLTPRQGQVLQGILDGDSNKQIAARLNLSVRTVEMHRGTMMRSLGIASPRELLALIAVTGGYHSPQNEQTTARGELSFWSDATSNYLSDRLVA